MSATNGKTRPRHLLALIAVGLLLGSGSEVRAGEGPVFAALADELDRSGQDLVLPGLPPPYFLSYRVVDSDRVMIKARYGALVQNDRQRQRQFWIDLRVGDPSLDNSYFVGDWRDLYNFRKDLIEEDDYFGLRHQIWLHTDAAYKKALETLAGKKAYLAANPVTEEIPDFTPAASSEHLDPQVELTVDVAAWEERVCRAAGLLQNFPALQDWEVTYITSADFKYYLNTEGSRCRATRTMGSLGLRATVLAEDGQRLTGSLWLVTVGGVEPCSAAQLNASAEKLARDLTAIAGAPALDEYSGPVLFSGYAAAQFLSQLFAEQLSPARPALAAADWLRQRLPAGKLTRRLNRRVMPDFLSVCDDPTLESHRGVKLMGHRKVDDEGVACQRITLVEDGRLVGLPMTRRPARKLSGSNGHARMLANQWLVPAITNLFLEASEAQSEKKLLQQLRRLAGEFGNEYGLLIELLDDPRISGRYRWSNEGAEGDELLTDPVIAYKVYVEDGRLEPVRGIIPDEVTVRTLRDIVAVGKEAHPYHHLVATGLANQRYSASIVTPSILVEEMDFKGITAREPLPFSASPLAEK